MTDTPAPKDDELEAAEEAFTPDRYGRDRISAEYARLLFAKLLPDADARRLAEETLAQCIKWSHAQSPGNWGVSLFTDRIALNVGGGLYALSIRPSRVYLALHGPSLTDDVRATLNPLVRWDDPYDRIPDSVTLTTPAENLAAVLPLVTPALERFVTDISARYRLLMAPSQRAHSPGVLSYLRSTLNRPDLPDPEYPTTSEGIQESSPPMPITGRHMWKIAPGADAHLWNACRDAGHIVLGWSGVPDFTAYSDEAGLQQALMNSRDGREPQAVLSCWPFAREIKPGDIVVANQGRTRVVGIGVVAGEYLPAGHPQNPNLHEHYPHARSVDWRITEPVSLTGMQFAIRTLTPVSDFQWERVKAAYLAQNPALQPVFAELDGENLTDVDVPAADTSEVRELLELSARTKNLLLYGPPGTGKTYTVSKFAERYLRDQLRVPPSESAEAQIASVVQEMRWYEAIALAMSLMPTDAPVKVQALESHPVLREYVKFKSTQNVRAGIWAQLQIHTGPQSSTVNYGDRSAPFLFDKHEDSTWYLTDAGQEYVQENLSDALSRLRNPQSGPVPAVEDYCEFVTFHQSYSYEDFVEGLRPVVGGEEEAADGGQVRYEIRPGVFRRICARAEANQGATPEKDKQYVLVLDEINRANISKVFGELITLIEDDKRLGAPNEVTVRLPYSGDRFGVPRNLLILGTMNTADRSIALLDIALRRRFTFVEMPPRPELLHGKSIEGLPLDALLDRLNRRIAALLDDDHRIGHSYLMGVETVDDLRFAWYRRVVPLLLECFHGDAERLRLALGRAFERRRSSDADLFDSRADALDLNADHFAIETFAGRDGAFLDALRALAGVRAAPTLAATETGEPLSP